MLGVALVATARRFKPIFDDFAIALPTSTQLAFGVAQLLAAYWYSCFLPLCAWPFVFWGVASLSRRAGTTAPNRLWSWATWLALLVFAVLVALAFLVPLATLLVNLSARW
jgi:hypothetical protein